MDEGLILQAQEWFDRGTHDIETAQLLNAQGGYTDIIAYHIQQAIEKYLKGFLILNGERPPRIHDLDKLLALVDKCDPGIYSPFIELCEKATRYYLEDRYPPGPPPEYNREEIIKDMDLAWSLISQIRRKAGL
jgi:HEPN domain-containing protein